MNLDITRKTLIIKKDIRSFIWIQLYIVAVFGFFRDIIGIPGSFYYTVDLLNLFVFVYALLKRIYVKQNTKLYYFIMAIVIIFFLFTIAGYIAGDYSILLYLWGLRNNYRFYIAFFSCAVFFKFEDVLKLRKFFTNLLYLNVIASTFEFTMGYTGDYLGGTFGIIQGVNGYTNILMIIVTSFTVVEYLSKKSSFIKLSMVITSCLYLAIITELKFYIFELVFIIIIAMFSERISIRKIVLIAFVFIGIVIGIIAIGSLFPVFKNFFTFDEISKYIGDNGYTGKGDFNRLNAVRKVKEIFFKNDIMRIILGFGLGNCSFSSFDILTSEFYNLYNALHYQWFTDSFIFVETGTIGLLLYEFFYIVIFIASMVISHSVKYKSNQYIILKAVGIISICCIICSIYDVSLQMEASYYIFIILSAILIIDKQNYKEKSMEKENDKNKRRFKRISREGEGCL